MAPESSHKTKPSQGAVVWKSMTGLSQGIDYARDTIDHVVVVKRRTFLSMGR